MPHGDGTPTPDDHATTARAHLDNATRLRRTATHPDAMTSARADAAKGSHLEALLGIGHALLAVAGQIEVTRTEGVYRPEDGR